MGAGLVEDVALGLCVLLTGAATLPFGEPGLHLHLRCKCRCRRLANRWLCVAWKLWQTRQPYDETYHHRERIHRSQPRP